MKFFKGTTDCDVEVSELTELHRQGDILTGHSAAETELQVLFMWLKERHSVLNLQLPAAIISFMALL